MRSRHAHRAGRSVPLRLLAAALVAASLPASGQQIAGRLSQPGWQPRTLAYYQQGGRLLVGDDQNGKVFTYDGATLALVGSADVGQRISALVVHQGRGRAYAYSLFADRVAVLDAQTGAFLRFLPGTYFNVFQGMMQIDESLDALYLLSLQGLFQFDLASESVVEIGDVGGGGYEGLGVNPVTHEVFVTRFIQNELVVANGVTRATETIPGLGGLNNVVGVNPIENKVYIARGGGIGVPFDVYDRDTGQVRQVFADNDALVFAFDPVSDRMYTDGEVNRISTVLEGSSDAFHNVTVGGATTALGVLLSSNRVYLAGTDHIAVIDDATLGVRSLPLDNPQHGGIVWQDVAIDQARGRVFTVNDSQYPYVTVVDDGGGGPPPPEGPWLTTAAVPGFRTKVRIGSGDAAVAGRQVTPCLAETLCVAGAVADRAELFVRVVGPKPNGKLWPTLVKFSTSRVQVWIEQTASGDSQYYDLAPVEAGERLLTLDGLADKLGFDVVAGSLAPAPLFRAVPALRTADPPAPDPPAGPWLTTPEIPGFRAKLRISGGGAPIAGVQVTPCIDETLCVAGSLPDRAEVFVRVVGPKPNGKLWPTLVKFSTSRIEVWIEQTASGQLQYYDLPAVEPGERLVSLAGLADKLGFDP